MYSYFRILSQYHKISSVINRKNGETEGEMFRDFDGESMSGEKQIFVDVAMVIKTMLLNPGRFSQILSERP